MNYLTKDQVDGLLEVFKVFDTSGDGQIDKTELAVMFRAMGMKYSEAEIIDIIALKDKDGSGTIDFAEFLALMTSELRDQTMQEEIEDAFERMCGDDGRLGQAELLRTAHEMGVELSAAEAGVMLQEVSKDRQGGTPGGAADAAAVRITQTEVVRLMQGQ